MVEGVARGDRLVRVGAEVRDLVVERGGKRLTIAVRVTAF